MKVKFPNAAGGIPRHRLQRYYRVYYGYVLSSLKYLDTDIELMPDSAIDDAKYLIEVDGQTVVIDYSDHLPLADRHEEFDYYFKFHYSEGHHEEYEHVFPFTPISFYDWNQYFQLSDALNYTCTGNQILSRQVPAGNAIQRRRKVQSMLQQRYGSEVSTNKIDQTQYWTEVENCLVSVCAPGSRNNMLDRGQLQYMALGACTISPKLINILPGFNHLIPGEHYVVCKDDYSDLFDVIEWCRENREECVRIGDAAKSLFQATSTPEMLWGWVTDVIKGKVERPAAEEEEAEPEAKSSIISTLFSPSTKASK